MVYGAFPVHLSSDLHRFFIGSIANSAFFWMTVVSVPLVCVLPFFAARQLQRYLRPAYYQVAQEMAAREREAGGALFEGVLGAGPSGRHGRAAPSVAARASRLMARKVLKAGSAAGGGALTAVLRRRYSGYVAPYDARSRVFDSNELRASALAAGYTINSTGEIVAPPPSRLTTLAGAAGGGEAAPPMPAAAAGLRASTGPLGAGGMLARALSGIGAASFGRDRRTISLGATSLPPGTLLIPSSPGAAPLSGAGGSGDFGHLLPGAATPTWTVNSGGAPAEPPLSPTRLTRLSVGTSALGGGADLFSLTGGYPLPSFAGDGAVPSVARDDPYAGNPVLAQLEREFSLDPRRHKRHSKLSILNISNMPRIRSRSPKVGKGSRGSSPMSSRSSSLTGMRMASASVEGAATAAREAEGGAGGSIEADRRLCASEGGALPAAQRGGVLSEVQLAALRAAAGSTSGGGAASGGGDDSSDPGTVRGGWRLSMEAEQGSWQPASPSPEKAQLQGLPPPPHQQQQVQPPSPQQPRQPPQPLHPPSAPSPHHQPQHRGMGSPSRLLRMAAPADPPPSPPRRSGVAAAAALPSPGTAARVPPLRTSAVTAGAVAPPAGAAAAGPEAAACGQPLQVGADPAPSDAASESMSEDPAMLQLYRAALSNHGRPG
jgi:hypothetical protein